MCWCVVKKLLAHSLKLFRFSDWGSYPQHPLATPNVSWITWMTVVRLWRRSRVGGLRRWTSMCADVQQHNADVSTQLLRGMLLSTRSPGLAPWRLHHSRPMQGFVEQHVRPRWSTWLWYAALSAIWVDANALCSFDLGFSPFFSQTCMTTYYVWLMLSQIRLSVVCDVRAAYSGG